MDIKEIYTLRDKFSIIGLTGKTGSGCTRFSKIISKPIKYSNNTMLREPKDIVFDNKVSSNNVIFKRKYSICYNYFKKHDDKYETISYISSILFYTIHYFVHHIGIKSENELVTILNDILRNNFKKSVKELDNDYNDSVIEEKNIKGLCSNYTLLIKDIKKVEKDINTISENDQLNSLFNAYWGECFIEFTTKFYSLLGKTDYYLGSFFVHRLGNKIRATGNPMLLDDDLKECADTKHIYSLAILINKLIKSWKHNNETCHICIDSLRNSLEIMFFKERYSAFYMIAIHNDGRHGSRIEERIFELIGASENEEIKKQVKIIAEKVTKLDEIEHGIGDFKDGHFFAPDVENCIQKSEIHINNPGDIEENFNEKLRSSDFYTMIEQWVKIKSLISHPGLITPSHEERCMQIAYNSKFNSGCISRQVGAIITDEYNSIRSVGWNDVPKGSTPCNIRNLEDIIYPERINLLDLSYSVFETSDSAKSYKAGGNFSIKTKDKFKELVPITSNLGLNHSFCFKTLHNKYEGKDNQVHTRSLHAEENAMLQISKYGGQPLKNGTLYTTASPCELCAKKAYQLGIKTIIYIDPYPGISMKHILENGYNKPSTKLFTGVIGKSYNKLFEPLLAYKDELSIIHKDNEHSVKDSELRKKIEEILATKDSDEEITNKIKEIIK